VTAAEDRVNIFRTLHIAGDPLVMPNPWDVGTAKVLESMGFLALATTSSGFAATLGRPDGAVSKDEAIQHGAELAAAVAVPVSADLENGFGDEPDVVRRTVADAVRAGLAGCSIEDFSGDQDTPIYELGLAVERIAAAAEAARNGAGIVLTARAENYLHSNPDLSDTISRLQAYQQAGADVLYAPGLSTLADIRTLVASVDRPVNVLVRPGLGRLSDLAEVGVARISVGGAFSQVALGALVRAARELVEAGTFGFLDDAAEGRQEAARAFGID
jgi:2-methylisocitrate lyase-like PEP mutase family enzyme